jgi:hypothetical protein
MASSFAPSSAPSTGTTLGNSSESSNNEVLCKLKKSFDIIFDSNQPLEKLGKIVTLWTETLPPGSCDSGVNTLTDVYLYDKSDDYFNNVISTPTMGPNYYLTKPDLTKPEGFVPRTDKSYSSKVPIYIAKCLDEVYKNKTNPQVGTALVVSLGTDGSTSKTQEIWVGSSTIQLDKKLIDLENIMITKNDPLTDNWVVIGPYHGANLVDYRSGKYTSINNDQINQGSDGLYYRFQKLSLDQRDLNIIPYRLRVYKTRFEAEEATRMDEAGQAGQAEEELMMAMEEKDD